MNELLNNKEKIVVWLNIHRLENYTLISDSKDGFIVDVAGDVDLYDKALQYIPAQFNSVLGHFYCHDNKLSSLEGGPTSVGVGFYCGDNNGLGEYQKMIDFKVIKEKILSDKEKKSLSESLDNSNLKSTALKL